MTAALFGAVVASPRTATACFHADHLHRILLGVSDAGPVFLELDLHRGFQSEDENTGRELVSWTGSARIRVLASEHPIRNLPSFKLARRVHFYRLESRARALAEFRAAYARAIAEAQSWAAKLPGFVAAPTPSLALCGFGERCGVRVERQPGRPPILVVDASPTAARAEIDLPARFLREASARGDLDDVLADLSARRLLTYATPLGTVLVVDLALRSGDPEGDEDGSLDEPADALWPPCRGRREREVPPAAATLEHGAHVELVLALGTATRPPASKIAPAADAPLARPDLEAAERAAQSKLRTDGIYVGGSVCDAGGMWRRRFLRFFGSGRVRSLQANLLPQDAARRLGFPSRDDSDTPGGDLAWGEFGGVLATETGGYRIKGRRVTFALEREVSVKRRERTGSYDGAIEGDRLILLSDRSGSRSESFVFLADPADAPR